jgi:hypothetical protein
MLTALRGDKSHTSNQEKHLVETIRVKREEVKQQLKTKLGISEEAPEAREKRLEIERLNKLGSILTKLASEETDDELLVKFGLVNSSGEMTRESMVSPLFRLDTQAAFDTYLNYAQEYDRLEKAEEELGTKLINTAEASITRRKAHDFVADLVSRDLGLPFNAARRFVDKARDAITPGLNEKTDYAATLRGRRLADKFGHNALAFTQESLRSIIESPMPHEQS